MKPFQGTAASLRAERESAALKLRGISAVMLAQTGETWPVRGARHTASARSRALSSVSDAALRTARMKAKRGAVE